MATSSKEDSSPKDEESSTHGGDAEDLVYYFAIGSMMNPVSIRNRNIHPVSSEPAELLDHRLGFFSRMGYADSIIEPGASLHGVIHSIRASEMAILDKFEVGYKRKTVPARLYDGRERLVQVYHTADSDGNPLLPKDYREPGIPSERYLDVLIQGAEHFGVKQSYIDWLKSHKKIPRPTIDTMHSFSTNENCQAEVLPVVSFEDVKKNNGYDGRPFWMAVNGKVLEAQLSSFNSQRLDYYRQNMFPHGGIMELFFGKYMYDPLYGNITEWKDVTPEYSAWCEHATWEHFHSAGDLEHFRWIARVSLS